MSTININGIQLYYEIHGVGQPLILINGLKADHTNLLNILESFAKHYQVIIFDNRGTGQSTSPTPGYSVADMAEDVAGLIDHLQLKKPHIVGHSLGGAVAQHLAWQYPNKIGKLVICNTFAKLNCVSTLAFDAIIDLHRANLAPEIILKNILPWALSEEFLQMMPDIVPMILESIKTAPFQQTLMGYQGQMQALANFDSRTWLQYIQAPTLVLAAKKDLIAPLNESEELATKIPNAKLTILPGGHASSVEQPDLFVKKIIEFLEY